jgi:hypothetical protein
MPEQQDPLRDIEVEEAHLKALNTALHKLGLPSLDEDDANRIAFFRVLEAFSRDRLLLSYVDARVWLLVIQLSIRAGKTPGLNRGMKGARSCCMNRPLVLESSCGSRTGNSHPLSNQVGVRA